MKTRIKEIRKRSHMTQTEFGEAIGVKGNTVTGYETGLRVPSDAVIHSICRDFGVNEHWLRTGEGDMFMSLTREQEISAFVSDLMDDADPFKKRLISAMAKMTVEEWKMLERVARKLQQEEEEEQK